MLAILFACQLVPLHKLAVRILQEIDPVVDDVLIGGEPLLEPLVPAAKVKVLPVPAEAERLAFVPHQLDVVLEEPRPLPEIVASFFLGVEQLLVDEVLDEGVNVGLQKERIAQTGLSRGDPVIQAPHPEPQEGLLESGLTHGLLVIPVEG